MKAILFFLYALSFTLLTVAHADEEKDFAQAYSQYTQALEKGDAKAALQYAKKTYDLGMLVLEPDSESLLAVTDNYAALLLKKGDNKGALKLYKAVLADNERAYGRYAKSLVPILESIYKIEAKFSPKSAEDVKVRYFKLLYRHNPGEIAKSMDEGVLPPADNVSDVAADITATTGLSVKTYEGDHWSILYTGNNDEGAKIFDQQLEISYRSIREFLISANLAVKPLDTKLVAILFQDEAEYMDYLKKKDYLIRGKGSYSERAGLLIMHDNLSKRSDWNFFKQTNFITKEALQQVAVAANVFSTTKTYYPLWLYDGLAYSFEFNDIKQPFGPHTQNISSTNWSRAQDLIDNGGWLSIQDLVRLDNLEEKEKSNKEVLYIMGTYLVRFLYEQRGDELIDYLLLLPKQNKNAQKSMYREKAFRKAFGDPADLEKDWRRFLKNEGIELKL